MLSDNTIRRINVQIQDELRTVDSISSSHQEKMEAIERIAALKALFNSPAQKNEEPTSKPTPEFTIDFGRLFRR